MCTHSCHTHSDTLAEWDMEGEGRGCDPKGRVTHMQAQGLHSKPWDVVLVAPAPSGLSSVTLLGPTPQLCGPHLWAKFSVSGPHTPELLWKESEGLPREVTLASMRAGGRHRQTLGGLGKGAKGA